MKSQTEIFRETLEGIARKGGVKYNFHGVGVECITPTYEKTAQDIAEDLLEMFPKEDSEHVQAYRALMTLVEYMDDKDFESGYHIDDATISEQLLRLRPKVETRAKEDILQRLEIDTTEASFGDGFEETTIHDPVSKVTGSVSYEEKQLGNALEARTEQTAFQVLEAPL